jgi:hypothetical protein
MVGGGLVVIASVVSAGTGVDGGLGEAADVVEEAVVGFFGDGVGVGKAEVAVRDDFGFGSQLVPDPADADAVDGLDAVDRGQDPVHVVDQLGFNAVHEPPVDVAGGILEDEKNGDGDEQSDDGVGEPPAGGDTEGTDPTAREVRPSVRAWRPSATRAADPIWRPTRMR